MEAIHSLLHSMSHSELRIFRASLTTGAYRANAETKAVKLLEFLLINKKQVPNNKECSLHIYNKAGDKRFKMLKSRLRTKIFDSLLNDINIERQSASLDEFDYAAIKIRKKFAQFWQLYYSRGDRPFVKQLLNETISLSKKWEYYPGLTESLRLKKWLKGFRQGEKEFDFLNKEIAFYELCNQALNKAIDFYYRLIMKTNFSGIPDIPSIQKFLLKCIAELKMDYSMTHSANIGYYLKFLELAYFQNKEDYSRARGICEELIDIINNNKAAYRKQRIGGTYLNLGQCDIYLNDNKKAALNIRIAQKHFPKHSLNYSVLKEQEFLALFYGNNIKDGESVLFELQNSTTTEEQGSFRLAQYEFYHANILFKNGDHKSALKILNRKQEISKDKIGWDIAIRMLTVMSLVELEYFDEAAQHIESLRKHMDRHFKIKESLKERDRLVLKVLQAMEKKGFVFEKMSANEIKILDKLGSKDKKYRWEPLTPELIPFHEWMEKKYEGRRKNN